MNYPILAIDPRGFTQIIYSDSYWEKFPIGFISMFKRPRGELYFFSKNGTKWKLLEIQPSTPIGWFTRTFRGLQETVVNPEFEFVGEYSKEELRQAFRSAVEVDDDILAQHYSHDQILEWVDKAESTARLFNLYRFITKDFTKYKNEENAEPESGAYLDNAR